MTAIYQQNELKFQYPENWTLTDAPDEPLPRAISLESPGGHVLWSVHLHPADADGDAILDEAFDTLRESYEDLEMSTESIDFDEFEGKAFGALFFCLDFLVRIKLQVYSTPGYTLLLWYQCEDRDFDAQEMVFRAISTTLMQSLEQPT
ncbi:hypothetical protein [Mariniblastus fucicola]|uniref:DUF1795 domain-containing protein n=1 Tax=Mariniblastus fucicola TaxID=980251 RepID=A0A5B9PFK8_9BACT|nr:hypothetical protein [Mariniblastus fucicola]QEG25074.1 hypothetical protein MFFC18_49970 [Mariniblastus fucicola]